MKEKNSRQKIAKILILGLENSGKTSILLSLTREVNLLSYCSLKPTVGISRVNFEDSDKEFSIWDFGGQEQFRKDYLRDMEKHLTGINKLIYVIDVQDKKKYDLTLDYFENIVGFLKNVKIPFELLIFLHKFDPGLEKLDQYSDESINSNLIDKLKKIVPSNFNSKIFKTSIYTVFQKVLIK